MPARCDECKFALRQPGTVRFTGVLNCRRYPPQVIMAPAGKGEVQPISILPAVDDSSFCGEFQQSIVVITRENELVVK